MRTFTPALMAAIATRATNLKRAVTITRRDAVVKRFTDLPEAITIHGLVYEAGIGITIGSLTREVNNAASRMDITLGIASDFSNLDLEEVLEGLYDQAIVRLYVFDADNPVLVDGVIENLLFYGTIQEIAWDDTGEATLEALGPLSTSDGVVVEQFNPVCRADFGDRRCRVPIMGQDPEIEKDYEYGEMLRAPYKNDGNPTDYREKVWMCTNAGLSGSTIPAFLSANSAQGTEETWGTSEWTCFDTPWTKRGQVSATQPADPFKVNLDILDEPRKTTKNWFKNGMVIFRTGILKGRGFEIRGNETNGTTIQLFIPLPLTPSPGDWFEIFPGCDHSHGEDGNQKYDNILNYRGEPFVPSPDVLTNEPEV